MDAKILIMNQNEYRLLSVIKFDHYDTAMKMFDYMKENDIPLEINTSDSIRGDGDEYFIKDIRYIAPTLNGQITDHIQVFVE